MDGQKSEFKSQFVAPQARVMAAKKKSRVRFEGDTTYEINFKSHELDALESGVNLRREAGESNKLSSEMKAIQEYRQVTKTEPTEKEFVVTRRNRHAPVQTKYSCTKKAFAGVTVARASYKPFDQSVVIESRKNRFPEESLVAQGTPKDLENHNKESCTTASYVNHGPIPKTKPVVPVKFAGDGRVFTTSRRTQYRDAYNDFQTVEISRRKPTEWAPTKAKFRDTTTSRLCYRARLPESQRLNGPTAVSKGPDSRSTEDPQPSLPLTRSTTYTSNFAKHDVRPRQREKRVTPTEALVKIKFSGKSNTQMSYVSHPAHFYLM